MTKHKSNVRLDARSNTIIRARLKNRHLRLCETVESIQRKEQSIDYEQLEATAVSCILGEEISMSDAQREFLNYLFYNRTHLMGYSEWIAIILGNQYPGFWKELDKRAIRRQQVKQLQAVARQQYEALVHVLALDLRSCSWLQLVGAGMKPITASFYLGQTRQRCERVVLCKAMLSWLNKASGQDVPNHAPTDPTEYQKLEYATRRLQLTNWPGLSAQACERIVLASHHERLAGAKREN